jgi:hypothetical protein
MTRDRWTDKFGTIIARVEAGEAPARIREIHVFGSFARGALEPNDLDLIVVHDEPGEEILAPWMQAVKSYSYDDLDQSLKAYGRFQAAMRKVFRRGGERMDIKLAESLDSAASQLVDVPRGEIRLVWSETDRDWQAHLAGIAPDPNACRHPRHHFINVKRAGCNLEAVENVTEMIDTGVLTLEKLPLGDTAPPLNREFQHWLDHWTRIGAMGAAALKVLPWAMWWLQEQGARRPRIDRPTGVVDDDWRFHVQIGRMPLNQVLYLFEASDKVIRQCLIPHRKAREENWMYVLERGPKWEEAKSSP